MNAIKQYMEKNRISKAELAKLVGVDQSTIYRQLNGQAVSIETAKKYSAVLGIPITEILGIAIREDEPD